MPRPDYLCVDAFLRDAVGARALATAFELGWIDRLLGTGDGRQGSSRADAAGTALLEGMLRASGVLEATPGPPQLSGAFRAALGYRELLEAKLDFLGLVGADFLELFTALVADPARFQRSARLFELFSYDRGHDETPENLAHAARWMRFTTALTRHEAPALLQVLDLAGTRRMLDVGGNSGEFALQACRRHPELKATVLDLPVVCALGERHVAGAPEGTRVAFARVPRAGGPFPGGQDLVTFKSMLHDWPDGEARRFLRQAREALRPGGRVALLERSAPVAGGFAWADLPLVLFFRSYRAPDEYRSMLEDAGFRDVRRQVVDLDMPFLVMTATAP